MTTSPPTEMPTGSVGRLTLSGGDVVLFDETDRALIERYTWFPLVNPRNTYAYGYLRGMAGAVGRINIAMHRLLLDPPEHLDVDHWNNNGLDNRKINLRVGTRTQNNANRRISSNNTSGYKGVSHHRQTGKWRAYVSSGGQHRHLGIFPTPEEAALAYNAAALELWGPFARLNEVTP